MHGQQPSYNYPPPGPPPRRQSHVLRNIALSVGGLIGALIAIAVGVAIADPGARTASPAAASPTTPAAAAASKPPAAAPARTVTYEVTGSDAQVTYGPAGSELNGHSPMRVTRSLRHPAYYSVTAQLQGDGSVTCEILVSGKVVSKGQASGTYNIATCEIVNFGDGWQNANSGA